MASAPGLEPFTARELSRLFSEAAAFQPEPGGVTLRGGREALYRANLHLRTAGRILARLGMPFLARDFGELEQKAARLPWERCLAPGQPLALRVTCRKSKLYHSEAVAERILAAIAARLGRASLRLKPAEEESGNPPQLILVRLAEDRCTVSADSSGELLHRRGYRLAGAKAPLRETLAAGMLLASGWDCAAPLLDPFCGSGTIPIEAALLARGLPPGLGRRFAFMDWPDFDADLWERVKNDRQTTERPLPPILASDRDAGAIRMAQENAARAGVADCVQFTCRAVSALEPPAGPGWVVTNPPYGRRVSAGKDLRGLYARFGDVLRARCPAWQVCILSGDPILLGQTRLPLDTSLGLLNGGLQVRLGIGKV